MSLRNGASLGRCCRVVQGSNPELWSKPSVREFSVRVLMVASSAPSGISAYDMQSDLDLCAEFGSQMLNDLSCSGRGITPKACGIDGNAGGK